MNIYTFSVTRDGEQLVDVAVTASNEQEALFSAICKAQSWYSGTLQLSLIRTFEVQ